jgi:DNA-binding MarR family transcriptional regulator
VTSAPSSNQPPRRDRAPTLAPPADPAPVPKPLAHETGYLLRRAYVYAGQWAQVAFDGVPARRYEVLQALSDLGPRSQHQLSELLWVNRTIMVKLIDALEGAGLVERRRNPADRRAYALVLTPSGEHARTELSAAADRADAGLTASLTALQRRSLGRLLSALALVGEPGEPPPELPAGLSDRIGFLLTAAHHRVRARVNESLGALGLTTALYGTLATIDALGPIGQQPVAAQLGLTGPAIVQTVDRLESAGLVKRRRAPADRRSYALEPTERGHEVLRQARGAIELIDDKLDEILGGTRRRHELGQLLHKLIATS